MKHISGVLIGLFPNPTLPTNRPAFQSLSISTEECESQAKHDGGGTGRFPKIFEFKAKMQPSTFSFETRAQWSRGGRACAEGTRNAKIADAASRDSREN